MGKVNTVLKTYMGNDLILADVCNYLIYQGKQVIQPENLSEKDPAEAEWLFGKDRKGLPVERVRDILRLLTLKTDGNTIFAIFGVENQDEIHYGMPVRNMLYDALAYANQVRRKKEEHDRETGWKDRTDGEYLSGLYKEDRLLPVITVVVYFGADHWDGPTSLHEMLEVENEEILKLVNDYQIHLISPEGLSDEELGKFHMNLREVLTFIKYSQDEEKCEELFRNNENYAALDRDAAMVLKECTNVKINFDERKEKINMCLAWDEHGRINLERGMQQGLEQGMEQGIRALIETCQEFGLARQAVTERIIQKFSVEIDRAEYYMLQYWAA